VHTGWRTGWLRSSWVVGLVAVIAVLVASCTAEAGGTVTELPATDVDVVVTSIADGDSFRAESPAGEIEVRLLGMNSPELDECHGLPARAALGALIENRTIGLATEPELDQFDRVLARAVVNETYVNLQMVSDGHSLVVTDGSSDREALLGAEEVARTSELGMWASDVCGAVGPQATLDITDVDFDPPGPDEDESVTIINSGADPIDLVGFVLRDESSVNRFEFPDITLASGEELTIARGCTDAGEGTISWCTEQPIWNNDGDAALVLDEAGRIVAIRRH